jgi:hypothetical protein
VEIEETCRRGDGGIVEEGRAAVRTERAMACPVRQQRPDTDGHTLPLHKLFYYAVANAAAFIGVAESAPGRLTAQLVDQYGGKRTALPQMPGEYSSAGASEVLPPHKTGV